MTEQIHVNYENVQNDFALHIKRGARIILDLTDDGEQRQTKHIKHHNFR